LSAIAVGEIQILPRFLWLSCKKGEGHFVIRGERGIKPKRGGGGSKLQKRLNYEMYSLLHTVDEGQGKGAEELTHQRGS